MRPAAGALATRLRRQKSSTAPTGTPQLVAIVTEASLLYQWGTGKPAGQIQHLIKIASAQRGPSSSASPTGHRGLMSPINIFDFPDGEPSMAYTETDIGIHEVTSTGVNMYSQSFDRAVDALEPMTTLYRATHPQMIDP
jgi:hypothetical protein